MIINRLKLSGQGIDPNRMFLFGESSGISSINGLLDFDGNRYIPINSWLDASSDIDYDKKITFNLWLDSSEYIGNEKICEFYGGHGSAGNNIDCLYVRLDGSLIYVATQYLGTGHFYPIGLDYNNQILDIEINKKDRLIQSFKINGVSQSSVGDASLLGIGYPWNIGTQLNNATLWDFKIYDTSSAGELIHHWKGYPDGNTDSAWIDQIGTLDGSVGTFSGPPSTRNIGGGSTTSSGNNKLLLGYLPTTPSLITLFTWDDSIGDSGTSPLNGQYFNNYYLEFYQPGGGGTELLRTLSIDGAGVMTYEASLAFAYPSRATTLNGMVFVTKQSPSIVVSSFYIDPNNGVISLWKTQSTPVLARANGDLGSCNGKFIQAANGASAAAIEVYSFTTDSSGGLTRDSSLSFTTVYTGSNYNKRIISGANFCYLMRVADGSVAHTDILTISGGVLTDTGYDISIGGIFQDLIFDAFEDNGYLYSSYQGVGITKHSINQTTGEPTLINTYSSPHVGIYSNLIGDKIINEGNDTYGGGVNSYLKSINTNFQMDGSFVHYSNVGKYHSGIVKIDNSTFITSRNDGNYKLDSFTITPNQTP